MVFELSTLESLIILFQTADIYSTIARYFPFTNEILTQFYVLYFNEYSCSYNFIVSVTHPNIKVLFNVA